MSYSQYQALCIQSPSFTAPGYRFHALQFPCLLYTSYSCLRCREPCDRHSERRAGYVVESDLIAESDRLRISAVFSADTQLDVRPCLFSELYSHLDQLSYAYLIDVYKRQICLSTEALSSSSPAAAAICSIPVMFFCLMLLDVYKRQAICCLSSPTFFSQERAATENAALFLDITSRA